jgi:hypothetical protein
MGRLSSQADRQDSGKAVASPGPGSSGQDGGLAFGGVAGEHGLSGAGRSCLAGEQVT